jgi:hypothetical protein
MRTLGNSILDDLRAALSVTLPPLPASLRTTAVPVRVHVPPRSGPSDLLRQR